MTTRTRRPSLPLDPAPGERLKDLRLRAGLTQSQLAEPQYTKAYVSALENGLIRFSMAAGQYLAGRLGVSIVDLLDGGETVALRLALIAEHRKVVADTSGNMAGHVAIRDGWLEPDPDTGWSDIWTEECSVCDLIGARHDIKEALRGR